VGEQVAQELTSPLFGDLPDGWDLPRAGRLTIRTPLALRPVATSHGWSGLAPSAWDGTALHRTLLVPSGPLTVRVTEGITVSWGRALEPVDRACVREQVTWMLCLHEPLTSLYEVAPAWLVEAGMGRLLRSPSVWEDLARTLATTNCSWALTKVICRRLCEVLGTGGRSFPTAEQVAAAGPDVLREQVRVGYRAQAFAELATAVAEGSLQPQRWLDPALSEPEVMAEILALRGFGPYAAEGMLGLLGRPRGFALDSWIRARLPALLGTGAMSDAAIRERYAPFGRWGATVLWCELTRDW
jgi:3-methyladenine DNA glycosylase/8-oxoguanine DNA glycosylase